MFMRPYDRSTYFFMSSKVSPFSKTLAINFPFVRLFLSINSFTITWALDVDKTLATLLRMRLSSVNSSVFPQVFCLA